MHPVDFVRKWSDVSRTERSGAQGALHRTLPRARPPTPADLDKDGSTYTFEKGATKSDRRQRLGRRLVPRALRLGVQGTGPRPRQGVRPAPALQGQPREPAAARRLRPRPHRHPHQLHQHASRRRTRSRWRPSPTAKSQDLLRRMWTDPMSFRPRTRPGERHRGGGREVRAARPEPRVARARPARRRPLPRADAVLPVRRGHRAAAQPRVQPPARLRPPEPRIPARRDGEAAGDDGDRRVVRAGAHPARQRRALPGGQRAGADPGGGRHPRGRRPARLEPGGAGDLRDAVRALAGPGAAQPAGGALHRPRGHHAGGGAGGDAAAAPPLGCGPRRAGGAGGASGRARGTPARGRGRRTGSGRRCGRSPTS